MSNRWLEWYAAEPVRGEPMDHCNARTDFLMISHGYRPGECTECDRIAAIFTDAVVKDWARLDEALYLSGDEDCGVGIVCRWCDRGGAPVAYYQANDGWSTSYEGTDVVLVCTIGALLQAGRRHIDGQHKEQR